MSKFSHRSPWTLRRQLVVLLTTLVLLICSILAIASSLSLRGQLTSQLDHELHKASARTSMRIHGIPESVTESPTGDSKELPDLPLVQDPILGQAAGTIDVILSGDEVVRAGYLDDTSTPQTLTDTQMAALKALPTDGTVHRVELPDLGSFRAIATTSRGGDRIITAMSTVPVDEPLKAYLGMQIVLIIAAIGLAAAASTIMVRQALRPLQRVAASALQVSSIPLDKGEVAEIGGVDPRDTDPRTEVGTVGAAFNRMLGHVESALSARHESETQVRQFVADASHELRTPLASIRGYAELVRRSPDDLPTDTERALDRIESEALRMGSLVEDLLLLARLDAGRPLDRSEVDLVAIAVDALADAHAAGREHVWELDLPGIATDPDEDCPVDLTVRGDEARLRQVLANLLGNARVHTPAGTRVVLGLHTENESVIVTVTDNGPGIPSGLLGSLFQRFSRGDSARNRTGGSTGLGLAIAQAIIHEHGGEITARNSHPGATFEVRLPTGDES